VRSRQKLPSRGRFPRLVGRIIGSLGKGADHPHSLGVPSWSIRPGSSSSVSACSGSGTIIILGGCAPTGQTEDCSRPASRRSRYRKYFAMSSYYTEKLSSERLRACYELAPPRTKDYLQAEIEFVLQKTSSSMAILELGCGYGRVLRQLLQRAHGVVGIDTSMRSLRMASEFAGRKGSLHLVAMDAAHMGFRDRTFDLTVCIQNGISAFGADQSELFTEAVRVTRSGGRVLFSTYCERFWEERLKWFEIQAEHGLIGEIDYHATGNGVIVCKDGFRSTTTEAESFRKLSGVLNLAPNIIEVDGSSLFCEIAVP